MPSGTTMNGVTYNFATSTGSDGFISDFNSSPNHYLTTPGVGSSFQPGDSVTFSFSAPVNSFGIHISTALGATYQFTTNATGTQTSAVNAGTPWDDGTSIFLGLISSSTFTSATLTGGYKYRGRAGMMPWSGWNITQISYGVAAVPLPAAFFMFLDRPAHPVKSGLA